MTAPQMLKVIDRSTRKISRSPRTPSIGGPFRDIHEVLTTSVVFACDIRADQERRTPISKKLNRPDPIRWFWYAYGRTLPEHYRPWVLRDLTAPSRWVRQVLRTSAVLAPFALVGLVLAGNTWIVWTATLGGYLLAVIYSLSYIDQYAQYRLGKHGFPHGTFTQVMAEAQSKTTTDERRLYDAIYRSSNSD